jgi:hypothetical protein
MVTGCQSRLQEQPRDRRSKGESCDVDLPTNSSNHQVRAPHTDHGRPRPPCAHGGSVRDGGQAPVIILIIDSATADGPRALFELVEAATTTDSTNQ